MAAAAWIGWTLTAIAVVGIAYQLVSLFALWRFFRKPAVHSSAAEPVTLLKPLHGAEPRLADNLATFLEQDYAATVQMICGVSNPSDAAVPALETVRASHPRSNVVLTTGHAALGGNGKIGNLAHMVRSARHEVLVQSDSDMAVPPDYLATVVGALQQPGVGAVSCLYTGRGDTGIWSRLDAAIVSYSGMPKVVMSLFTGAAVPCMGSTIALRRKTLEEIGSFEAFADVLADDYAIGEAVRATGKAITMPPMLLVHASAHESLGQVWRQHLRWAVTIRGVQPLLHVASGVVYAVPLSVLSVPFLPLPGLALLVLAIASRLAIAGSVDRIAQRKTAPLWLVPVADCTDFAVWAASLAARTIHWRGSRLTMTSDGRI
jgi:ceramide glucosyltransferase